MEIADYARICAVPDKVTVQKPRNAQKVEKTKLILTCVGLWCILVSFAGCNLLKSPISMVKKISLLQLSWDDEWESIWGAPTYTKLIQN